MKKVIYFLLSALLLLPALPVQAIGQSVDHVVIAALQTGQTNATGNDFIILYNPTDDDVDVTGWKMQYRSATATGDATWTTKRTLACVNAAADCHVTIAPKASLVASTYAINNVQVQPLTSGFSGDGGQIRLLQPAGNGSNAAVIDLLGYGSAATAEGGKAAAAPPVNQAIIRKNVEGFIVDTDVNADDFVVGCLAIDSTTLNQMPLASTCEQAADTTDDNTDNQTQTTDSTNSEDTYLPLTINELLPDPATPATDASDEFIEMFNPNDVAVNAAGYRLQTGSSFQNSFTLDDQTVAAGDYIVVYSAQSHLSLTNSGTPVRLLDPNDTVVDNVASYGIAKTGQAWAKTINGWQWTTTPTPGAANIVTQPIVVTATPKATNPIKPPATKTVTTTKTATPKTTKVTAAKTPKTTKTATTDSQNPPKQSSSDMTSYVLFGLIGLGAACYVGYEYRHEIARASRKTWAVLSRQKTAPQVNPQLE